MGSTGSGTFGNYRLENDKESGGSGPATSGGGKDDVGGKTGEINCPPTIENIRLEDVASSDYYVKHQSLPSSGTPISLRSTIYKGRLVVEISATRDIIGNLPTEHNNLLGCIKKGLNYTGSVVRSGTAPVPFIVVTLHA